jgi:hypothetical protein
LKKEVLDIVDLWQVPIPGADRNILANDTVARVRTRATEDRWMVTLGCDECLKTWCGLTLGRVLQVHVAV